MPSLDIDWMQVFEHVILLSVAYVLAFPMGWDREREERGASTAIWITGAVGAPKGYFTNDE